METVWCAVICNALRYRNVLVKSTEFPIQLSPKWSVRQSALCANYNAMRVEFPLRQSIVVSFALTASPEMAGWEAKGKGAYLRAKWKLEIGTSD